MLLQVALSLAFCLALSVSLASSITCEHDLFLTQHKPGDPREVGDKLHVGELTEISAKSIKSLVFQPDVVRKVQTSFGADFGVHVVSTCRYPPGWTTVHLKSSDRKASLGIYADETAIQPLDDDRRLFFLGLYMRKPKNWDRWSLSLEMFSQDEKPSPVTILPYSMPVTVFPEKLKVMHVVDTLVGYRVPDSLIANYTCLLQLTRNTEWPRLHTGPTELFRLKSLSPITKESEWRSINRDCDQDYGPDDLEPGPNDFDVTRFHALNKPHSTIIFEPIFDEGTYHIVGFVSG